MAESLGIEPVRLETYEAGRVPLTTEVAHKLCATFDLSQQWLAEEKGIIHGCIEMPSEIRQLVTQCSVFSEAYDKHIKPLTFRSSLENIIASQAPKLAQGGISVQVGGRSYGAISADEFAAVLAQNIKVKMDELPPEVRVQFRNHILRAADNFYSDEKSDLTCGSLKGKTDDVKSELEKLVARVKRLANKPGAKSALAKFLKVAPARITEWLHEDPEVRKEPGGDYTLRLLQWVEQQERQK